jgi:hypothetical protein
MRILLQALGLLVVLTAFGCGDSGVTEGTVPFKATDTSQFDEMKNQMIGNLKTKSYTKKQAPLPGANTSAPSPAEKSE